MRALLLLLVVTLAAPALARRPPRAASTVTQALYAPTTFGSFTYQFSQTERIEVASGKTIVAVVGRGHTPWMGWFPMRVSIDNTLGPKQTVKVVFRTTMGGSGTDVTRLVEVDAGARVAFSMPVPAESRYGMVEASSPVIGRESSPVNFTSVYDRNRLVLAFGTPEQFEAFIHAPPNNSTGEDQVLTMPLDEAPTELAAYLGTSAVAITDPRGFEGLGEAQRTALEAWVATGGTLLLPSLPRTAGALPLLKGEDAVEPYGLGHVALITSESSLAAVPQATLPVAPLGQADTRRYTPNGTASYSALLPQAMVPVARFLIIITLFTLLIGPGSVWLARRRGPAILLASIPVTAFATCVVILSSSLLLDGFTVHAATYGYTLLDARHHRAVTVGVDAWYANLAPRSGSFPSTVSLVAPQRSGDATSVSITWGDGARYGSGYIPSRTYREWGVVGVEATRARLVVKQKGDGWVLQNGLGHRVQHVWVRLGDALYSASDVRDGAEVALTTDDRVSEQLLELVAAQRFVESQWKPLVMAPLGDGEFLGAIEGAGFVSTGGVAMNLHDGKHVVRGEVER